MVPDQQIDQQSGRYVKFVHDGQRAGIDPRAALDPPVHSQRRGEQAHPGQDAPLQGGLRQLARVSEEKPRRQGEEQRAEEEMAEEAMQRHIGRVTGEQLSTKHLAGREAGIGNLEKDEADQVVALQSLEADDDAAADSD